MKVTNCLYCPFMVLDVDFYSTCTDTLLMCNLVKFLDKTHLHEFSIKNTDYDKFRKLKKVKPLKNCPLKTAKITVEYER